MLRIQRPPPTQAPTQPHAIQIPNMTNQSTYKQTTTLPKHLTCTNQAAYDFGVRPQELLLLRREVAALEQEAATAGSLRSVRRHTYELRGVGLMVLARAHRRCHPGQHTCTHAPPCPFPFHIPHHTTLHIPNSDAARQAALTARETVAVARSVEERVLTAEDAAEARRKKMVEVRKDGYGCGRDGVCICVC